MTRILLDCIKLFFCLIIEIQIRSSVHKFEHNINTVSTYERCEMKKLLAKSANGVEGCLIYSGDNKYVFRVYSKNNEFIDYNLLHSDLSIVIRDSDAYFYTDGEERNILDHSPRTLGLK